MVKSLVVEAGSSMASGLRDSNTSPLSRSATITPQDELTNSGDSTTSLTPCDRPSFLVGTPATRGEQQQGDDEQRGQGAGERER